MPVGGAAQRVASRRLAPERLAELGREHRVADGVDDAVGVEQHASEVHDVQVRFEAEIDEILSAAIESPYAQRVHRE